jgi:pyrimidine operon attenuation protein/uracil phosphoribosyltransferase
VARATPSVICENLVVTGDLPPGTYVLVDDVYTSGVHVKAWAWKLVDHGRAAELAICCGRALHSQLPDPFEVKPEELDIQRSPFEESD